MSAEEVRARHGEVYGSGGDAVADRVNGVVSSREIGHKSKYKTSACRRRSSGSEQIAVGIHFQGADVCIGNSNLNIVLRYVGGGLGREQNSRAGRRNIVAIEDGNEDLSGRANGVTGICADDEGGKFGPFVKCVV